MNTKDLYSPHSYIIYGAKTMSPYHIRPNMEERPPLVKKKVTFKPTATVRTYSRDNGGVTEDQKSTLYYSKNELNIFHLEVKAIYTLSQGLPHVRNSGALLETARDSTIPARGDDDEVDSLRGVEMLLFPLRMRNKLLARKSLLKYQAMLNSKPGVGGEQKRAALAAASARLSRWSSLVAAETARLDSVRAHGGDDGIPIDPLGIFYGAPFPFHEGRRRQRGLGQTKSDADGSRRQSKRRKTEQS